MIDLPMRKTLTLLVLASLALAGAAEAAAPAANPFAARYFGARLARAEVVVIERGAPAAYRIDRGRVRAFTGTSVELVEHDGTAVTVPLAPEVRIAGRGLRRGIAATVVRPVGGAATEVYAGAPAAAHLQVVAQRYFGPRLVRAEVALAAGSGTAGYRIDRGRVRAFARGSLTLVEADATTVSMPVAPDARVQLQRRRGSLADLRRGALVLVARELDRPATDIYVERRR